MDGSGTRVGRPREPHIEALRGLACVLLACVHVVGDPDEGLKLPPGNFLNENVWAFQPLRMPLFAFISGLVFDAYVRSFEDLGRKLRGKAQRLLLPLLTVGTLFFVIRAELRGLPLSDVWTVYFTAYEQFWYLPATFALMTVGLVAAFILSTLSASVLLLVAGCGLYLIDWQLDPDWFSITKAFYLAPFFFLGQLLRLTRFQEAVHSGQPARRLVLASLAVVIVVLVILRHAHVELSLLTFGNQGLGMLLLSLALCTFALTLRWNIAWLARIGPYSYAIFLFHLFFTGGSRVFMQRAIGVADPYVLFVVGMVAGLIGPIVVQRALLARPWLAWAFLGQHLRRERPELAKVLPVPQA